MKSKARASKKPKILVVDDEPDNLDLLYRTFYRDYKVLRAESGPVALELLAQTPDIAVIISDQRMPMMSGTELLSLAAVQYPDIIRIILTGYTDVEDLVEAINSGKVFKYVTKPWEAEHLKEIVSQALDTHNVLKVRTDELSRSLRRESLLNTVINTIRNAQLGRTEDSPLQQVLQTIVNTVGQVIGVDICILRPFEGKTLGKKSFVYQKSPESSEESIASNLKFTLWETREVEVIHDIATEERFNEVTEANSKNLEAFKNADICSTLIVPLIGQLDLVAVMALHRCGQPQSWNDDEIQLAVMVADQAALAISQARAYEQVESLAQREVLINTITTAIRSTLDPQEIFAAITQQLGISLDVDGCALSLWTEEDEFVRCVGLYEKDSRAIASEDRIDPALDASIEEESPDSNAHSSTDPSQLPQSVVPIAGNPVLQKLLNTQKPVVLPDMDAQEIEPMKGEDLPLRLKTRALLVVPLLVDGNIIGSISLRQTSKPRRWNIADIELAQAVASQAAIAVQQSRLYQKTRQQAERLLELDRQKTEFFQNISHEFRTPLTLMIGPLESVTNRKQDLDCDRAQIVLRNSRRLLRLVNQLLDLQRLDAGRMQGNFCPCDLGDFIHHIVDTFRPYCEKKGLNLHAEIESCESVHLDVEKFDKVLYNLLSNAMKFTPVGGSIIVRLKMARGRICLQVRDTGIGIAASQLPFLFDRFRQAEGSINRSYEGTGLGLALVKEMVELHGGTVEVESIQAERASEEREGHSSTTLIANALQTGTTFTILLPTGIEHLPPEQVQDAPVEIQAARAAVELADLEAELIDIEQDTESDLEDAPLPDSNTSRVLVVDDNPDLRTYVSQILRSEGYYVRTARNGEEGFERVKTDRPHLVVTDLMMPKVSGIDLIRLVRNEPEYKGTPIILLTAKADEASRIEGTEQGADSYLSKPFNDRELLAEVRNLLSLKENEKRVQELNQYLTESVLSRFLPPTMVQRAAQGELTLDLQPEPRLVTILFSDIVGFTPLSNTLQSRGIAQVLNEYLEAMTEVIFANGGTVDKFMGDAIVALFGPPEELEPNVQVERAIAAARGMIVALEKLNQRWQEQGILGNGVPLVQFRCGIHQGTAVVGMFGSNQRSDYTAIGPAVNIASRLQEAANPNSILVSAEVADYLQDSELSKCNPLKLKGIDGTVLGCLVSVTQA
ncbi:response regulator [Lusitaniella coriacea]|uniref:response regulator n=1 Tax=Lusitaniella coriacea TaxID=1983105 RepID=UPI003CF081F4